MKWFPMAWATCQTTRTHTYTCMYICTQPQVGPVQTNVSMSSWSDYGGRRKNTHSCSFFQCRILIDTEGSTSLQNGQCPSLAGLKGWVEVWCVCSAIRTHVIKNSPECSRCGCGMGRGIYNLIVCTRVCIHYYSDSVIFSTVNSVVYIGVVSRMANRPHVLPELFNGKKDFAEWVDHFGDVAAINLRG